MRRETAYIYLLLVLLTFSCGRKHCPVDFERVEAIMPQHPDSALGLLDRFRTDAYSFSLKNRAHYYLLLTEAEDRCWKDHLTDSQIELSLNYYKQKNDAPHYAKALYLKGRIMEDWKMPDEAVACFVEALDVGADTNDYSLLYHIASHTGMIYAGMGLTEQAMDKYQAALRYAVAAKDSGYIAQSYSCLGRMYNLKYDWTHAAQMYEKAVSIATESHPEQEGGVTLNEYLELPSDPHHNGIRDPMTGVTFPSTSHLRNIGMLYLAAGDYYRLLNDTLKAVPYLRAALRSDNLYTQQGACQSLYYVYQKNNRDAEANYYHKLSDALIDSIQKTEIIGQVSVIESNYNKGKAEKKIILQKYRN